MNFDPKAIRRALMIAKDLAVKIDPGFAVHNLPMPPEGVPLERAKGGEVKNVLPVGSPERSQNLREWLGDSFLHDEGNPRTYYHGTSKDQPFTGFKVGRHGAWFTSDPKDASMYAQANDSMSSRFEGGRFVPQNTASRVMPVYLKANNPFLGEFPEKYKNVENYKKAQSEWFDELRANGYDSWIPRSQEGNLAVMLEGPHQVKSAIGNVGTFDPSSPDIAKAEGGEVEAAGMGINVRSDKKAGIRYADEIVDGNKKYETRDTDSLRPYVGKRVAIVRTGEGPAKAIGEVTVGEPIVADQAMFHKMRPHHLVPAGSAFDIKPGSQKYLYPMHDPERFDAEKDVGAGIIARKVMSKAEGGAIDKHPDQGYSPKPPGILDVDNPGGDWLKENREYSESKGYLPSGAPNSFGKVTAVWRKPESNEIAPVYLPVSMLAKLPGVMSEQGNVRSHDLDWLVDHMGKTGKLPKVNDREYKPFITVDHRGRPFVSEGNHRIMAAAKLGWDYLPVEVRYFNGAEDVDGPLHPDRIKAMQPPKKQIGGAVEDDDMPARKLNDMGMYSAAAEAARNLPQERGTLQQMLASLKGIKPDEINFSDVQNRLGDKPIVTKQELADYFSRNIPKLEVTSLDEDSSEAAKNRYTDIALTMGGKESNYAEDLIRYSEPWSLSMSPKPAALKAWKNAFYTEHYPAIANILAHVRHSDREGPNGEKLLHLEELQSDWGQTGKKHGFENPILPGKVIEDPDYPGTFRINWPNGRFSAGFGSREIADALAVEGAAARAKYTPLVPHVGTTSKWMDLTLKHALNTAVKGNYDGIIWTPGDKQVERYKGISEIGGGLKYLYDNIVPKQLLGLAKEHDPSARVESLSASHDPVVDGFPLMRISSKMRESIKKRGFKAFSTGGFAMPQPVDSDKTIRRALMIAKQEGGPIEGAQPIKGLPFPKEDTAFRLRTKLNRETKVAAGKADPGLPSNPRLVIRAPKAKEGETQLPNFIVGPLTHKDWIARHEKILSPEEIQHSSQWYKNIYGNFLQYTNNNESEAKKLMRAWLVAQQNVSPAGAMQNVLLQREQMQRGVPEPLWRAGGMPNPTNAARSVLKDQPISGGVGQKISDFVDSAEGLDTRSYLGHDPRGGSPFVIDVHSARDAGLVDPALINHLKNLGYNENDLAKVQTDFEASPSDAQYENRAQWGRDLTKYLNKIGWQGKKDWRPEEIQAVGWMGMTKLTRNAEEDSASGLGRNLRRVSFELSPGEGSPWAQKYGTAFESLPDEERYGITQKMSNRAMQIASELSGVNPLGTVHGTGAWMQYQNPAAVGQALATQGGADIMANTIGHLLHQTEVWHNRVKPITSSPKGFAVDFIESGSQNLADRGQLRDFWQKITDADKTGLIQGYQPITLPNGQVGVRALVDKGGLGTHKKLTETLQEGGDLDKMLKELPFDVESQIAEAEITKARNDWKENPNGQAYLQRLSDLMGSDPSARLSAYGSQLEKELEGHLDEAYARQGRSWRATTPQGQQAQVKALETPPLPTMAYGGAIDKALQIALRART